MYSVFSTTDDTLIYRVTLWCDYDVPYSLPWWQWVCTCPAGESGKVCYHRALVALERGDIL
jgi:uncharacterized Zn finger protein